MKRILFLLTFACTALFSACEYDDSEVWSTLNDYGNRISKLEALCAQMNTNISSLQTIVNALQQKDFITTVAPITQNGKEIGYSITFSSGKSITIYHGNDGKDGADGSDGQNGTDGTDGSDGYTPKIGVKKDADGIYYWTIDGEWLTDDAGNKIQAQGKDGLNGGKDGEDGEDGKDGTDGADGKDGITPQLKIEEDYWYVSYDEGKTWTKLGKATGEDGSDGSDGTSGDNIFQSVTQDANNVYFKLADGTTITIPKYASTENIVLTYIPRYSDGKATVFYATKEDSYVELDFEVSPVSAAQQIASNWQSWATVKAVYTETRAAVSLIDMPIISCTADSQAGIITVKASGKNLSDDFFAGAEDASVRLSITVDNAKYTSDYVLMVAKKIIIQPTNEIWYTSTDGNIVKPNDTSVFGANLVSNTYENGKGVITFDDNITVIGYTAFNNNQRLISIEIPYGVIEIGALAFNNCPNLSIIKIPDSVEIIGNRAMSYLPNLQSIILPKQLKSIDTNAFANCTSLKEVHMPENINQLGASIFFNNEHLQRITGKFASKDNRCLIINGVLNSIAPYGLTEFIIPDYVTEIGDDVFRPCSYIKNIVIPSSVRHIGLRAFWGTSITNLIIPNSMTEIGMFAFYSCEDLQDVTIHDNVTSIGKSAFGYCSNLTDVTIPAKVTTIGSEAFYSCRSLTSVYCKPTTPPSGGINMFKSISTSAKIYVPVGSGAAYKAADGWKDYASMIEEKEM